MSLALDIVAAMVYDETPPADLAHEADRIVELRASGHAEELSRLGGLTAQFEPGAVTAREAIVAAWLLQRGDTLRAARVITPCTTALRNEHDLLKVVRTLIGTELYHSMLEAFSYDRDYARAVGIGRHLSHQAFDGFPEQAIARRLAAQLATRSADFVTFTLPDSAQWDSLARRLSRRDRIDYLARRLRLLNSFQAGQPGGVALLMDQFAEPWHLRGPWDETPNRSRRVINPLVALQDLDLTVSDIPDLAPYLADTSFMPTFGFWRDFAPQRDLYWVGSVIEDVINDIAHRPLVHAADFRGLDGRGRREYVKRLVEWARTHGALDRGLSRPAQSSALAECAKPPSREYGAEAKLVRREGIEPSTY